MDDGEACSKAAVNAAGTNTLCKACATWRRDCGYDVDAHHDYTFALCAYAVWTVLHNVAPISASKEVTYVKT